MLCSASVSILRARRAMVGDTNIDEQAYLCMHLGRATSQPGWTFEVMEGPRKGDIITAGPASVHASSSTHARQ